MCHTNYFSLDLNGIRSHFWWSVHSQKINHCFWLFSLPSISSAFWNRYFLFSLGFNRFFSLSLSCRCFFAFDRRGGANTFNDLDESSLPWCTQYTSVWHLYILSAMHILYNWYNSARSRATNTPTMCTLSSSCKAEETDRYINDPHQKKSKIHSHKFITPIDIS